MFVFSVRSGKPARWHLAGSEDICPLADLVAKLCPLKIVVLSKRAAWRCGAPLGALEGRAVGVERGNALLAEYSHHGEMSLAGGEASNDAHSSASAMMTEQVVEKTNWRRCYLVKCHTFPVL